MIGNKFRQSLAKRVFLLDLLAFDSILLVVLTVASGNGIGFRILIHFVELDFSLDLVDFALDQVVKGASPEIFVFHADVLGFGLVIFIVQVHV